MAQEFLHKELASGKWFELPLAVQLANIGSEVSRAKNWQGRDERIFWGAVERALELFDLTLRDSRWRGRLEEIGRVKEVFCDTVLGSRDYKTSFEELNRYFNCFLFASHR